MSNSSFFKQPELLAAYKKLKAFSYHDSGDLFLREQIVEFEAKYRTLEDIGMQLKSIAVDIESYSKKGIVPKWVDEISFEIFPKKLEPTDEPDISTFIKSLEDTSDFYLSRSLIQIKAGIEVHLTAILWTMIVGSEFDDALSEAVYSHRLQKDDDQDVLKYSTRLYRPYYKDYANWRNNSINFAKDIHSRKSNATIISMDIKDYFYNIDLDLEALADDASFYVIESEKQKCINSLLALIHRCFRDRIGARNNLLPIGLASSGVIGNFALHEIDKDIDENINPIYYGRYVDDIILVVQNLKIEDHKFSAVMRRLFKNSKRVNVDLLSKGDDQGYSSNNKDSHVIRFSTSFGDHVAQMGKLKIFDFSKDAPISLLTEFEKEIARFSSEARLLNEDSDVLERFNSESKKISYSDSILKLRSIDKFDLNRVGFSRYLSSLIQSSKVISRIESEEFKYIHAQILSIASGPDSILIYRLWEKLIGIYVSHSKFAELEEFLLTVMECISRLYIHSDSKKFTPEKVNLGPVDSEMVKQSWFDTLVSSLILSICADGGVVALKNFKKVFRKFRETTNQSVTKSHRITLGKKLNGADERIKKLRWSGMYRHHVSPIPIVAFCADIEELDFSSLRNNLGQVDDKKFEWQFLEYKWALSPRFIHYNEIAEVYIIKSVIRDWDLNFSELVEFTSRFYKSMNFIEEKKLVDNLPYLKGRDSSSVRPDISKDEVSGDVGSILRQMFSLDSPSEDKSGDKNSSKSKGVRRSLEDLDSMPPANIVVGGDPSDKIRIGVANVSIPVSYIEQRFAGSPDLSHERLIGLNKILNLAVREKVNLLVFPEGFIPFEWTDYIANFCKKNQLAIVGGVEHLCVKKKVFNLLLAILPFQLNGFNNVVLGVIPKADLNKEEMKLIRSVGMSPGTGLYQKLVFDWKGVHLSFLNCLELSDIKKRAWMRGLIDCLVAIENNRDTSYFSSIVESTARDLHCYVIQVNNSKYGDSRITGPLPSVQRDLLRIKGGENMTILVQDIPIDEIRRFQYFRDSYENIGGKIEFKDPSPGFPFPSKERMPKYKKKKKVKT